MTIRRELSPLEKYDRMADAAAGVVIGKYSTSFSLAARALRPSIRRDIHNLYAMVRIADEIVDGVATQAGLSQSDVAAELERYQRAVEQAINLKFSSDPILHAFAGTVRRCGIDQQHIDDFFSSMKRDLTPIRHDAASLDSYIHGSAEVIGLMCLDVFVATQPLSDRAHATCVLGAQRLGRAFQTINFLRDYSADSELGRHYLELDEESKARIISDIRQDLAFAYRGISALPMSARTGVLAAYLLFSELTDKLDQATIEQIRNQRISVNASRKSWLALRAVSLAPRMKEF